MSSEQNESEITEDELPDSVIMQSDVGTELAALRRFAYNLAEDGPEEATLLEAVDQAVDRITTLEERLDDAEGDARAALGVARQVDTGARSDGGPSKVERAEHLSRDEVIKRTAEGVGSGPRNYADTRADVMGSVTNGEIRSMARPEHDLAWQTVDDAWKSLTTTWDCFEIDESGDEKTLTVPNAEAVSEELARTVEESLGENGLAKKLVGGGGD